MSLANKLSDERRARRAAERLLEQKQTELHAANRKLANMSPEIRAPMNGVVDMADLLQDTELPEEQRLYAETIKNSIEALLVIINDVLDYSEIEAEKMVLHSAPFDLEGSIHDADIVARSLRQLCSTEWIKTCQNCKGFAGGFCHT